MTSRVVDTNVLVVANGRHGTPSVKCRMASIIALREILEKFRMVVDAGGEILEEYRRYCHPRGQPGVGDQFFREVLQNYSEKIVRIDLPKRPDGSYVNFPSDTDLTGFDLSDRKFVAAAVVSGSTVVNSTDSDRLEYKVALNRNGVFIDFVCTEEPIDW